MSMYTIARTPRHTATHNARAWNRMAIKMRLGPASEETLLAAIGGMTLPPSRTSSAPGANARAFLAYCVDSGWLREAK